MDILIVAHGPSPAGNIDARVCAVASIPGDGAALEQQAAEFRDQGFADHPVLRLARRERLPCSSRAQFARSEVLVESGALNFLTIKSDDKMSLVMLAIPHK